MECNSAYTRSLMKHVDISTSSHRSEPSSLHVEDVVVARAVFAALLRYHHELLSSSFEENSVLRIQAVHPRALREAGGRGQPEGRENVSVLERNSAVMCTWWMCG